jgi:hypothetical protein
MFFILFNPLLLWADQSAPVANTAASGGAHHSTSMPARGSTMAQVKKKFGNPLEIIGPSGETSKRRPPITRWVYEGYIVYFENNRVIHSAPPRSLDILKFINTPETPQQPTTESR